MVIICRHILTDIRCLYVHDLLINRLLRLCCTPRFVRWVLNKLANNNGLCNVCLTVGNVPVSTAERGLEDPRPTHPGAVPALHEAVAIGAISVAISAYPHFPRREA